MTSKLDYLQKYLAEPGRSRATKAKSKRPAEPSTVHIRDVSDIMPAPKEKKRRLTHRDASQHVSSGEDVVVVDEEELKEVAAKSAMETSGVRWRIQQHRPDALRANERVKGESGSDSDLSPVRKDGHRDEKHDGRANAARSERQDSDTDLSPPRRRATAVAGAVRHQRSETDLSPPRGRVRVPPKVSVRHGSDADVSPPRARGAAVKSVPLGRRDDADSDLSPPRTRGAAAKSKPLGRQNGADSDLSPPRTQGAAAKSVPLGRRDDADSDLSPPRSRPKPAVGHHATAVGVREGHAGQGARLDSDSDLSPRRKSQSRADSGAEVSSRLPKNGDTRFAMRTESTRATPKQRPRLDAGQFSRRAEARKLTPDNPEIGTNLRKSGARKATGDSDADLSPPRRKSEAPRSMGGRHDSDSDLSPPQRKPEAGRARHDSDEDHSPPRRNDEPLKLMGGRHDSDADLSPRRSLDTPDVGERMTSGHRAGLVDGRSLKKDAAELRVKRLAALESAPDAATGRNAETVYRNKAGQKIGREEWVSEQQKKRKKRPSDYPEQELEWGGGLKQTANREEEQEELSRIAAQPFARFEPDEKYMEELKNKQDWNDPMRQSVAAEEKQAVSKPKCPFAPWPNRFNIAPGYRWDGKVRGNGYEHRWLDKKNHREFKKKEAYIYENLED